MNEMFLLIFALSFVADFLNTIYMRRAACGDALAAGLVSGLLALIAGITVIVYVENRLLLLPDIIGCMVGTFLAVLWDKGRNHVKRY